MVCFARDLIIRTELFNAGGYTGGSLGPSHTLPSTTGIENSPSRNATITMSSLSGMKYIPIPSPDIGVRTRAQVLSVESESHGNETLTRAPSFDAGSGSGAIWGACVTFAI